MAARPIEEASLKTRVAYGLVLGLTVLVGWVSTSHALTLGDLRGSVVVGRALDVSVVVRAGAGEDISAACFKVEVFHADTPQANATVTVRPLSNAADGDYRVRVQSPAPVDEPVVTVQLHSTCTTPLTRRYVVLADFPVVVMPEPQGTSLPPVTEPAAPVASSPDMPQAAAVAPVPAGDASSEASSQVQAAAPATAPVTQRPKAPKPKAVRKKPSQPVAAKPAPAPAPVVAAHPSEPARPALKLEPLNLPVGQTDGLASAPLALPSPEAILQASQIKALQDEIKQFKAQTTKTSAQLAELQTQLEQAQSERISLQLFYGVLAVMLLCVAALSWLLWQRYREQSPHDFGANVLGRLPTTPESPSAGATSDTPATSAAASLVKTAVNQVTATPPAVSGNDLDARAVSPTVLTTLAGSAPTPGNDIEFTNTRVQGSDDSSLGAANHDEVDLDLDLDLGNWSDLGEASKPAPSTGESLQDVPQSAGFLDSSAETEHALARMKQQISEGSPPDPSVYLDLLSLFHSLGYKTDFREYRAAFNRQFNCALPDFPAYHLEGLDLMSYPQDLAQLTQAWSQAQAITYLRSCINRTEQISIQSAFDLAAFRELLLLLAIAEQVFGS